MPTSTRARSVQRLRQSGWLLLTITLFAASAAGAREPELRELFAPYQQLLDDHLVVVATDDGGLVSAFDYQAALAAPQTRKRLTEQRQALADFDPGRLTSREAANAFWINAYNHFMLAYLLEHPEDGAVVDSVRDFGHLLNPFRVFEREVFEVGNKHYSLDDIEKGILLGDRFEARGWKDARIHFAVNCASVGCPPLRQQIYLPETLDAQLTDSTRRALATPYHLRLDGDRLYMTELFDWYASDFVADEGSVLGFIQRYGPPDLPQGLDNLTLHYIDYDWSLNRPANFPELRR